MIALKEEHRLAAEAGRQHEIASRRSQAVLVEFAQLPLGLRPVGGWHRRQAVGDGRCADRSVWNEAAVAHGRILGQVGFLVRRQPKTVLDAPPRSVAHGDADARSSLLGGFFTVQRTNPFLETCIPSGPESRRHSTLPAFDRTSS